MTHAETEMLITLSSPGDISNLDDVFMPHERIDWNHLFVLALWHKVAFLVLERLRDLGGLDRSLESGLPLLLLNHWKQLSAVNAHRNAVMFDELSSIGQSLESHGLEYMVGKGGPLLIGRCYGPSERKMYDVDLLASRSDLDTIRVAMADAGYQMANYDHDRRELVPIAPDDLRKWLLLSRGLPNFIRATGDPLIEITIAQVQFKVGSTGASGRSVPADVLLGRRERLPLAGTDKGRIWAPDASDTMVQLALHISRETLDPEHEDWGMSWNLVKFSDLARFVGLEELNLRAAAERSRELGFDAECAYALTAVDLVFPSERLKKLLLEILGLPGHCPLESTARLSRSVIVDRMSRLADRRSGAASPWTEMMGTKTS